MQNVYIFGAGENGSRVKWFLKRNSVIVKAFIDNDKNKQGGYLDSTIIISPEKALKEGADKSIIVVAVSNPEGIMRQLENMGFKYVLPMGKGKFFPAWMDGEYLKNVVPFDFYESPYTPVHYLKDHEKEIFGAHELPCVDLNESYQLRLLEQLKNYCTPLWFEKSSDGLNRYYYGNTWFHLGEARILCKLIQHLKTKRIIEVGSGFSTAVMLDTNSSFMDNSVEIISIEPNAERLKSLIRDDDNIQIVETIVQEVDLDFFEKLEENDILFIDSSHVSRPGSDVNRIIFSVLPKLKKGVYVHFHDILPFFEYSKRWVLEEGRAYNEAYLLHAFLMNNEAYSIQLYTGMIEKEKKKSIDPSYEECADSSIWIRKEIV